MSVILSQVTSSRIGSETALSGTETITSSIGTLVNHEVPAATDDSSFALTVEKSNLEGMFWISDGDAILRLVNETPLVASYATTSTLTLTGDYTHLKRWQKIAIMGSTSNDGVWTVLEVDYADPTSTITVAETGTLGVEAVAASVVRVFDAQDSVEYAITAVSAGAGGTFTITGDLSALNENQSYIGVSGSTNNDNVWKIDTAVEGAGSTVLTVIGTETVGATADGDVYLADVDYVVDMVANQPSAAWTTGGGLNNPLLNNVTSGEVTNASVDTAIDVQGRLTTA